MRRPALAAEAGATLVEVLAAVALMGIAFLTILGGMMTTAVGSDISSKKVDVDVALRAYAERVEQVSYTDCADAAAYGPGAVGYSSPAGFTASVTQVRYWQPDADPATGSFVAACSSDAGLQRITLNLTSDDARATATREVLKRSP